MTAAATGRSLLSWLDRPALDRRIRFARPDGRWDDWTYAELAGRVDDVASGLRREGVRRDDVVSVVVRPGPGFVSALFGVLSAGATPAPVTPPALFGDAAGFAGYLSRSTAAARATAVLTEAALLAVVDEVSARSGGPRTICLESVAADGTGAGPDRPAELAMVQFTSGSTGRARAVRVPRPALEAMVESIRRWLGMDGTLPTASWLPPHHDMGLVGCLITPLVDRSDVWQLRPQDFIRSPVRYLRCFAAGAALSAMPGFGLDHVVRRLRPDDLDGLDLSGWRALVLGAERLRPAGLEAFAALLAPAGFRRSALLPAYGLAEATLAVTGLPHGGRWTAAVLDPASLAPGGPVRPPPDERLAVAVTACGPPLPGTTVRVLDGDRELAEGLVGEIVVTGPSVAAGYVHAGESPSRTRFDGDSLRTGDAGFLLGGQLHVLGRLGDGIKVRGRTLFAEDIESALTDAGLPTQRVAALLGHRGTTATVVVLVEHPRPEWPATVRAALREHSDGVELVIVPVARGGIARTTSGKPRRRQLWLDVLRELGEPGQQRAPADGPGSVAAVERMPG